MHGSKAEQRILARDVVNHTGQTVRVSGWVHSIRDLGGLKFLIIRDRSGMVQCVLEGRQADHEGSRDGMDISVESVVSITGLARAEERAPQGVEVLCDRVEVLSRALEPPPFEINRPSLNAGLDVQLQHRVMSLRHPMSQAIFKVSAEIVRVFREFLTSQGFTEIFSPKIVASGTEGGSALFPVDYFGRRAYLAQSPQFYKQMGVAAGFERVFEVGHAYRAEEHNTSRHLNEYVSLDLEMGFIQDEGDVMDLEEEYIRVLVGELRRTSAKHFEMLGAHIPEVTSIPRIRLAEAVKIIRDEYGHRLGDSGDLDPEGERLICQYAREKLGSEFVFITHFPRSARPMYAMPDKENPSLTRSFDLLFRGLEVTTGGQRIHDYNMLVESMRSRGLDPNRFSDYLETFKYGMPPHGGLAIGLERLTGRFLGLSNVREASAFPRDRDRLTP
ncbi:MAG TPA: aspartate--tRNA(Asn) ligase [Firmicutes bacterium]|nr:aspartate--tRNA(Asn) ligase [Bacillota bacterium]